LAQRDIRSKSCEGKAKEGRRKRNRIEIKTRREQRVKIDQVPMGRKGWGMSVFLSFCVCICAAEKQRGRAQFFA
jgi:hypothetical protein